MTHIPQHRTLTAYVVEHRPLGDRFFARDEGGHVWRTFRPQRGWTCFAKTHHDIVWMADFGNTRIYTCEHEATIVMSGPIRERAPIGD